MSIYSCYLVTQAAMQQFGLSKIPDQWFNWSYVHAPIGTGKPVTLSRIEVVPSGVSGRVQEWYTQVTEAGLASTFILMTDEDDADFPLTAKDPWGGGQISFSA